ncbi:MAG: hypothetical protein M3R02_15150 [Chloroflexota bacterium]|nr:hypothetical protein [Chloroflexota bacterium]
MLSRSLAIIVGIVVVLGIVVGGPKLGRAGIQPATPILVNANDDLRARVSALETRVAVLEAFVGATPPVVYATPTATAEPGTISFSGSGQTALDPFDLPGGLYKFSATCADGFFLVDMKPVTGSEYVSVSLIGSAPFTGSTNVSIKGGRYAVSIQCGAAWTLDIAPVV